MQREFRPLRKRKSIADNDNNNNNVSEKERKRMIDINSIQKSKLQIPTFSIQPYINIIFLFSVTLFFFQLYRSPSLLKYPPLTSHLFLYYIHIKYKDKFNCIFMLKVTYCDDGI